MTVGGSQLGKPQRTQSFFAKHAKVNRRTLSRHHVPIAIGIVSGSNNSHYLTILDAMKELLAILFFVILGSQGYAQLNCQFLLCDSKGEGQANLSVNAHIVITDSSNIVLYKETKNIKTNQFGLSQITFSDSITNILKSYGDYCTNYCGDQEYCKCDAVKISINCFALNNRPLPSICIQYIKSDFYSFWGRSSILRLQTYNSK